MTFIFRALLLYSCSFVNQVTILLNRNRCKNLGERKISKENIECRCRPQVKLGVWIKNVFASYTWNLIKVFRLSIFFFLYFLAGSMEDIAAILAVSIKSSFQIMSSDCTLTRVNSWLLGEMECVPFKECHDMVFAHKAGNVYGTVFSWTLKSPFEGVLTLFCR